MVNENKNATYEPRKVYNRRLLRTVLKNASIEKYGYHKVSDHVAEEFRKHRTLQ